MDYLGRLKSWIMAKMASTTIQMYKTELAILSAIVLLFCCAFAISKSVRFFSGEHPGIVVVALSVACEVVCDWRTEKSLIDRLKKFFGICLVIGLLLEVNEAIKSDLKVEELRAKNDALEANTKDRTISLKQEKEFILLCARLPKAPIKVIVGAEDDETETFAQQVRQALDDAGYGGVNAGIIHDPTIHIYHPIGATKVIDMQIVKNDTNVVVGSEVGSPVIFPGVVILSTNADGVITSMVPQSIFQIKIVHGVAEKFLAIGLHPTWAYSNGPAIQYLTNEEAAFFIPTRIR